MGASRVGLLAVLLAAACTGTAGCGPGGGGLRAAATAHLPPTDEEFYSIGPSAPQGEIDERIAAALHPANTPERGPDEVRFVIVRAGERHGADVHATGFHLIVGGGVDLPAGALRMRRRWSASGVIDGTNEQLQTMGVSIVIERGTPQPYAPGIVDAVAAFCRALAAHADLHPDCVVAMGEVPYANFHPADAAERMLVAAVRPTLPVPQPTGEVTVVAGDRRIPVRVERRDTNAGIQTGMMMRKGFGEPDRGMLFVYKHAHDRAFWNRNVFIPIDLAYIKANVIEMIHTMKPEAGTPPPEIPMYPSNTPVRFALEMPGGWFAQHGVKAGDRIEVE